MVSIHGDLHRGNTLLTPDDMLLAVDFEHSAVSQVRRDLIHLSWESGTVDPIDEPSVLPI